MAPYRCRIRDGCKDLVKVSMLSIHLGQFHIRYFSPTSERVDRPSGDMEGGGGMLVAMAKFVSHAYFRETGVGQEVH